MIQANLSAIKRALGNIQPRKWQSLTQRLISILNNKVKEVRLDDESERYSGSRIKTLNFFGVVVQRPLTSLMSCFGSQLNYLLSNKNNI